MRVLTVSEMREMDRRTVEECGISEAVLMETAGMRVLEGMMEEGLSIAGGEYTVFCGKGNNGGDGAVLARHLWLRGAGRVEVILLGRVEETKGEARRNFEAVQRLARGEGGEGRLRFREAGGWESAWEERWSGEVLVDALLGTGVTRAVEGEMREVIEGINRRRGQGVKVVAVDLPSGLMGDRETPNGVHVEADLTVTFTAPKPANVLPPAAGSNGQLIIAPIGTPDWLMSRELGEPGLSVVEREEAGRWLAETARSWAAHKGEMGRVLLIAGSRGKTGAAAMAARTSLLAGAGLVTVATPASVQGWLVGQAGPEVMTVGVGETPGGGLALGSLGELRGLAEGQTVVAIGPGLASSESESRSLLHALVEGRQTPLILDADGLNGLSPWPAELRGEEGRPIVLTPHVGEMARLLGTSTSHVLSDRVGVARELAVRQGLIVVLKGARTLIAAPDGKVWINPTGNAGMATAGSGDVLTGLLAGLLAQSTGAASVIGGVIAGVYLHGLSGDFAAMEQGERSLLATDLQRFLPQALLEVEGSGRVGSPSIRFLGRGR
jgi:NAD(P)H-hydrate epimerase